MGPCLPCFGVNQGNRSIMPSACMQVSSIVIWGWFSWSRFGSIMPPSAEYNEWPSFSINKVFLFSHARINFKITKPEFIRLQCESGSADIRHYFFLPWEWPHWSCDRLAACSGYSPSIGKWLPTRPPAETSWPWTGLMWVYRRWWKDKPATTESKPNRNLFHNFWEVLHKAFFFTLVQLSHHQYKVLMKDQWNSRQKLMLWHCVSGSK